MARGKPTTIGTAYKSEKAVDGDKSTQLQNCMKSKSAYKEHLLNIDLQDRFKIHSVKITHPPFVLAGKKNCARVF